MKDIIVPPDIQTITTRCYCLISKFPFFRFHFDFLFSLFGLFFNNSSISFYFINCFYVAVEHLTRLENQAPSILEERDEIEVFLSPSTPQRAENIIQAKKIKSSKSGTNLLSPRNAGKKIRNTTGSADELELDLYIPPEEELPFHVINEDTTNGYKKKVKIERHIETIVLSDEDIPKPDFECIKATKNKKTTTINREKSIKKNNQDEKSTETEEDEEEDEKSNENEKLTSPRKKIDRGRNRKASPIKSKPIIKVPSTSSPSLLKRSGIRRHLSEGEKSLSETCSESDETTIYEFHPCVSAMKKYRELGIPQKGQKIQFIPSPYLNPISFSRPFFDEEEELFAEWGLPLTIATLSFTTLCDFISAILLEKKILVYAENLRILSAIVYVFYLFCISSY